MTISYPLAIPTVRAPRTIRFVGRAQVGFSESPFTFEQQVYVHQGEMWAWNVSYGEMNRADAEELVAFKLALNGREGTFTMGDPMGVAPRGTWAGAPLVNGAGQTGKTLICDGFSPGATGKKGDYFQLGSGSSARLHKLTLDFTANGSGQATLDFWPRLRTAPADNAPLTVNNTVGLWRMASNDMDWDINDVRYGLSFDCIEAL